MERGERNGIELQTRQNLKSLAKLSLTHYGTGIYGTDI